MGFFEQFRSQDPAHTEAAPPGPANDEPRDPVRIVDNAIYLDSAALKTWYLKTDRPLRYEQTGVMPLASAEPVIELYDDGVRTREYRLETEEGESFAGKYFHVCVIAGHMGVPPLWVVQIHGFVSDTAEEREMTSDDIGYRMEGYFLTCNGEAGRERYEAMRGQDLVAKGLKYAGYTTPANVRLVGVCQDCGESFAFHGYALYMADEDVAYSDDGLEVCGISQRDIDSSTWSFEANGKVFRYYNSFRCPHCGAAYIDYETNHDMKKFGVSACTLIGHKVVRAGF